MPRSRPTSAPRFAGIEGLRAIAAGSVLLYHVFSYGAPDGTSPRLGMLGALFPKLSLGVWLFFCLSGFLLYRPFAAAALRGGSRPDTASYLKNRLLRILPAYWCIFLLVALVFGAAVQASQHVGYLADPALLKSNLLLLQNTRPGTAHTGITPSWSLAVEMVFYLTLPVLGWVGMALARRARSPRGRRVAALAPPGLLLLLGTSVRVASLQTLAGIHTDGVQSWSYVLHQSFWFHADLFSFGMAVAVLSVECDDFRVRLPGSWRAFVASGVGATVLGVFVVQRLAPPLAPTLWGVAFAGVLGLVVLDRDPDPPLTRVLEWRPLVGLGLISYSVFLWNDPVVLWLSGHGLTFPGAVGFVVNAVAVFIVTVLLSVLTYRLVEVPALRLKRLGRTQPVVLEPARANAEVALVNDR